MPLNLIRSSFTDWLVDSAISEANGKIDSEIEAVLRSCIEKKSEIAHLEKTLKSVEGSISEFTFDSLMEELEEIRDDFTWVNSGRGKYVSDIQNWVDTFHSEMRGCNQFDDLFVGAHSSLEVVYVCGRCSSETILNDLIEFLQVRTPPRKIMTNVMIE